MIDREAQKIFLEKLEAAVLAYADCRGLMFQNNVHEPYDERIEIHVKTKLWHEVSDYNCEFKMKEIYELVADAGEA